jgi:hypothetical protein
MLKQDMFIKITVETKRNKMKIELQKTLFPNKYWLIYNGKSYNKSVSLTKITNRLRKVMVSNGTK